MSDEAEDHIIKLKDKVGKNTQSDYKTKKDSERLKIV